MKPFTLASPQDFRLDDVLAFHRRDAESIAEEVSAERLRKGVLLDGVPVVLDIALATGSANITVHADGKLSKATQELAREAAISILGLRIDPAPFSAFVKKDKLFARWRRSSPACASCNRPPCLKR
jgi:DNA-3-methyladenine glycosylase II